MQDLMFCEEDGLEYQKEQSHSCQRPCAKTNDHGVAEGQET